MEKKKEYTSPSLRTVNIRPGVIFCISPFRMEGNVEVDEYEDFDFDINIQ